MEFSVGNYFSFFFLNALSLCLFPLFHQVVLKALDPVFEIDDPYAYNIQGNKNPAEIISYQGRRRVFTHVGVVLRSDHCDKYSHQLHASLHFGRHSAEEAQEPSGQILLCPLRHGGPRQLLL